jgi:hypothetical protein
LIWIQLLGKILKPLSHPTNRKHEKSDIPFLWNSNKIIQFSFGGTRIKGLVAGVITIVVGLFMLILVCGGLPCALLPILGIASFLVAMIKGKRLVKSGDNQQGKRIQLVVHIGFLMI